MAKFIQHRSVEYVKQYRREWMREFGGGCSFECDAMGNVNVEALNDAARRNWDYCNSGKDPDLIDEGVVSWEQRSVNYAIIECEACEEHLELFDSMTNRCECGAFYNGGGQRLSHPSNWGEETGEAFDDDGNQYGFVDD